MGFTVTAFIPYIHPRYSLSSGHFDISFPDVLPKVAMELATSLACMLRIGGMYIVCSHAGQFRLLSFQYNRLKLPAH